MNRPLYQQQDPELRRLKEAFVSNLQGTTRWEVFCVLSSLPLCLLTAAYIEARVTARLRSSSQLRKHSWPIPKFAFEFGGVVLPLLLVLMSVAPAEPAFLLLFLLWGSLALKLWMRLAHGPASRQHMGHMLQHMTAPRKRFVSAFRGGVMAATCLAILGVDFPAFPRRYAKAEGFGGGVMDVGVGAIIFAGGLVSAVAAGAAAASTGDSAAATAAASGSTSHASSSSSSSSAWLLSARLRLLQLLRGVKAAIPLLLLGGGREIATAIVGYQAHLGEYGLNWNFFYTIAAVTLLTLAVPVPSRWLGPLGLGLTAAHQVLLSLDISKIVSVTAGGASSILLQQYLARMPGLLYGTASVGDSSSGSVGAASAAAAEESAAAAGGAGVRSLGAWLHLDLGVEARQAAGFWASNKEGLGSLPGYWALYLLGAAVGHQLGASCAATAARARAQLASSSSSSRPGGVAAAVGEAGRLVWAWVGVWWVVDLGLWGLLAAVEVVVEPVSRRTCNFPYVLWTCAQCLAWLLLVVMADLLTAVICSSSGGCGTTAASSSILAPAPATGLHAGGSGKGSARRSLEAAVASAAAVGGAPQQMPDGAAVGGSGCNTAASTAAGQRAQLAPPSPPKAATLQRRSVGKRGGGSSPVATAAVGAAAAATPMPAINASGSSSIAAGSAAAVAAVVDSQHSSSSSREGSPREPAAGRSNRSSPVGSAGAHSSPKSSRSDKGSSPKGASEASSGSGSGAAAGGGTPVRSRRQGSRLQQPHLQACQPPPQQQRDEAGHGSSGSSGGPMRLMLAFNRNMLALFLIANLLTGAVNLSINTLAVGSWAARVIVGVYMLLLCSIAVLLDKHGITVKAW